MKVLIFALLFAFVVFIQAQEPTPPVGTTTTTTSSPAVGVVDEEGSAGKT